MAKKAAKKPAARKKSATRKAPAKPDPLNGQDPVELATIAIVRGATPEAVEKGFTDKGVSAKVAADAVKTAQGRIAVAADYRVVRELGLAIEQLRDVYQLAIKGADAGTALSARKELNKLLSLYSVDQAAIAEQSAENGVLSEQLAEIEDHLRPLDLAPDGYPIVEVVRIAADIVRRTRTGAE